MTTSWLNEATCSPLNGKPGRKKVAIIAASQIHKFQRPPFEDPEWDIWCCNSLWGLCLDAHKFFRADRWFELHPLEVQTEQESRDMQECPCPLYVLGEELCPQWITFPLDKIREKFGDRDFFTCTMCYQIALALAEGYTSIGLWGMELWGGSARERFVELRGVEFWMGVAKGMGVEVVLPEYSCLALHPYLYGYDYQTEANYAEGEVRTMCLIYQQELREKRKDRFKVPL